MNLNKISLSAVQGGQFDSWVWGPMPLAQPWKCRRAWRGCDTVWLIGQPGVAGCATVRDIGTDRPLDVALYDCAPETIRDDREGIGYHLSGYREAPRRPGWGLNVVMLLAADLASSDALVAATQH